MLQAAVLDGVAFDPFSFHQDGLAAPEEDIGRREVFQALVIAVVVVVIDEPADAGFEIARQVWNRSGIGLAVAGSCKGRPAAYLACRS